jgi:hypothetical protein
LVIYGKDRPIKIAGRIGLPQWWVQSVIIEYFPCRRFAENNKLWVFDFSIFDKALETEIPRNKVVIPEYRLCQNITSKDLAYRLPKLITGQSNLPLDNIDLIPEGLVNNTAFPFFSNPIDLWDPKLGFNEYAIVFDNGYFYQWKIAELYHITESHSWLKSHLFDLIPLWNIYKELVSIMDQDLQNPSEELRAKTKTLYDKLEESRRPLRQAIWDYHNKNKIYYSTDLANVGQPPLASSFDKIRAVKGGYEVESHLEPLLFRAAIRNYLMAEEARKQQNNPESKHSAILDELEYSVVCIISAANCLESYINYIIRTYLPEESKVFDSTSTHRQKWLWVPAALDLPFRFNVLEPPFKNFSDLVKWRNNAIHHTPEFTKVVKYKSREYEGTVSYAYSQFNLEHAKLAIKVVKDMVSILSKGGKIPLPRWLSIVPSYM